MTHVDADHSSKQAPPREWYGSYLTEDQIVADMVKRIKANPAVTAMWLDPESWSMASLIDANSGEPKKPITKNPNAGGLTHIGMGVRNYYGLWHMDCPLTAVPEQQYKVENGVITDERHPDNLSARIIERVRKEITEWAQ